MKTLGRGLLPLFILLGLSSWLVGQDNFKIRVGVVTYETFQDKDGELRALISQLSGSQNPPVQFQIAFGSYREVSHWLQTGEIDLALLTAGGYVRGILQSGLVDQYEYLATMDARPGQGPWVNELRKADNFQRYYRFALLMLKTESSRLETFSGRLMRERLKYYWFILSRLPGLWCRERL